MSEFREKMMWANGTVSEVFLRDGEIVIVDKSERLVNGINETSRTEDEMLMLLANHDTMNRILRSATRALRKAADDLGG